MMTFAVAAAALLALAMWLLTRRGPAAVPATADGHLAALRALRSQVQADQQAGRLNAAQAEEACAEIERRALEARTENPAAVRRGTSRVARSLTSSNAAFALGIPVLAISLYAALGNPQALDLSAAQTSRSDSVPQADVEAMVRQMAGRLSQPSAAPADAATWEMLGRSQAALGRYAEAEQAFARAIELAPRRADLMAERADLLGMVQSPAAAAQVQALLRQALELDPRNLKALALAGSAAFDTQDYAGAGRHWRAALALAPAGSEFAQGLERNLEAVQSRSGAVPTAATTATAAGAGLRGAVRLSPTLAARVQPDDTVFVFARPPGGGMPVAALRRRVADLPFDFVLDDSSALLPGMRLSQFKDLVLVARVSRAGDAAPRAGDLASEAVTVSPGSSGLRLVIGQVQP